MVGIQTKLDERIAHRNSGAVLRGEHALIERSCDRPAAQQRGSEPDPLLVGKARHFDGERQSPPSFVQIGDAGDRRDQPERTVPFAGVADAVVVRAQHQTRQTRSLAFVTAADISDRIEVRAHSCFNHPGQDQVSRRAMLGRQEDAREMRRRFGNRRQPVDPLDDLLAER